jgi:hypothetical protein
MSQYDITGTDLRKLVAAVYANSSPQGLGFLHFKEGQLAGDDVDKLLSMGTYATRSGRDGPIVSLDYVHGRACKFTVWRKGDRMLVGDRWFDHSPEQLQDLLQSDGVVNNGLVEIV